MDTTRAGARVDVFVFYGLSVVLLSIFYYRKKKMDPLLSLVTALTMSLATASIWELYYRMMESPINALRTVLYIFLPLSISIVYDFGVRWKRLLYLPLIPASTLINILLWGHYSNWEVPYETPLFSHPAHFVHLINRAICLIALVWIFYPSNFVGVVSVKRTFEKLYQRVRK